MAPAQAKLRRDPVAPSNIHRRADLRAEDGAQRTRGLLRHHEVERLRAGFGEAVLRRRRALQQRERCDEVSRRTAQLDAPARLELAQELVGAGLAIRRARLQPGGW